MQHIKFVTYSIQNRHKIHISKILFTIILKIIKYTKLKK